MSHIRLGLDDIVESAWRRFQTSLADALDELDSRATLDVRSEGLYDLGVAPCVHIRRDGSRLVIEAAANKILATNQKLSKTARRQLRDSGFVKESKADRHYRAELPATHVDQAASLVVSVLRRAYGVVHPSFLVTTGVDWHHATDVPDARESLEVVLPRGKAHVDELIEAVLTSMLGHPPTRDSDGDFRYPEETAVIFIRTRGHSPLIRLFAEMVLDVPEEDAALREVNALNREILGIAFTVDGNKIVAGAELQGSPFVPDHLQILLAHIAGTVAARGPVLAKRLGGRVFTAVEESPADHHVPDPPDIHPVMVELLRLEAIAPGALRPSIAAQLCGYDSALLNDLIQWNEDHAQWWQKSRDQAHSANDHDFADVCEAQRAHAARTARVLRKALRRQPR